jgi:NADP-dependent 3-hydroxy acid dehydrogenase YdfG
MGMIDINIKGVLYGAAALPIFKKNQGILLIYHPQQGKSICSRRNSLQRY